MKEKIFKGKIMKRTITIVLAIAMVLALMPVSNMTVYAENTTSWDDSTKTLTFTGSGELTSAIVSNAFTEHSDATTVVISGYSSIIYGSFENRTGITSVKISDSVTFIGMGAFSGCLNLSNITFEPSILPAIYDGAFYGVATTGTVTVPMGKVEAYKTALTSARITFDEEHWTIAENVKTTISALGGVKVPSVGNVTSPDGNTVVTVLTENDFSSNLTLHEGWYVIDAGEGTTWDKGSINVSGDGDINIILKSGLLKLQSIMNYTMPATYYDVTFWETNNSTGTLELCCNNFSDLSAKELILNGGSINANSNDIMSSTVYASSKVILNGGELITTSRTFGVCTENFIYNGGILSSEGGVKAISSTSNVINNNPRIKAGDSGSSANDTSYSSQKYVEITPRYTISKASTTNGSFIVSKEIATKDTEITITPTANNGYEVDKVEWKKASASTYTTITNDSGYKFTMPAEAVDVRVSFKASKTTSVASHFTFTPPSNLTAGEARSASVTTSESGMGTITVYYSTDKTNWSTTAPSTAGTYYVAIDVTEGTSYTAGTKITADSWKFTLENHTHTYATTWSKNNTYHWHAATCSHTTLVSNKAKHTWNSGKVTKEATTKATGVKTYTCTVCRATKTETIPKVVQTKANNLDIRAKFAVTAGSSIKVNWGKVDWADGYDVYMTYCGESKYEHVKDVKAGTLTTTVSKLSKKAINQKKHVKCYVVAYKKVDGKKVTIAKTITAHVVGAKNTKATDAKNITLSKTSYELNVGKSATIKATTVKTNSKLPILSSDHTAEFRYASSNNKVATVSSTGKITAKAKGTCTIYVYAVNGLAKEIKVTVK